MIAPRLTLILLALALATPGAAFAQTWRAEPTGVVVTPASGSAKRVRLQVMSDRIIRVTATPTDSLDLPKSLMVTASPITYGFKVAEKAGKVVLSTPSTTAEVSLQTGAVGFRDASGKLVLAEQARSAFTPTTVEGQPFVAIRQQFNPGTSEAFYGLGQHQNGQMNYNGEDVELSQYNRIVGIPFLVSTNNYGILWDNNGISRFGNPTPYALASRDLKIFDAAGKAGGFTARYYVGDALKLTRQEADINYQFLADTGKGPRDGDGWPAEMKGADGKPLPGARVVWEGSVEPTVGGEQRFKLYASSYFKVWVDGRKVIDRWRQNWNPWYHNFDVAMAAGTRHKIKVEWSHEDGYIALVHNNPMPTRDRHSLYLTSDVAKAVDYYYVGGGDLDQVISGYRQLTGKAQMLPAWSYGFWQSRQRYNTQDEVVGTLKEYRTRAIPIDNIVQDWFYWPEDAWGSHQFDPKRFPDPQAMVDQVHALNGHIMISIWPKFYPTTANFKELDAKGFMYHRNLEQGAKDWVGPGYANSFYDPYAKEARDIYWRQVKENLGKYGFDAWWMDSDEPDMHSNLAIPERTLRMGPTAIGPAAQYFNSYPLIHTQGVADGERASRPDVRSFILTRSAWGGIQRNGTALWSGDVVARWEDLHDQISAGVNTAMSGMPNWTHDIGGFSVEKRYDTKDPAHWAEWQELQLRWFQFGAFSPIFRSHGEPPFREIWNIADKGTEVYDSLVWYDQLRYRLAPYIYSLAGDTWQRDGSIMRGMVMDFPNDPRVRDINDQYLFGREFLVAPVTAFKARSRKVYLPAGTRWYDFYTGEAFEGGREVTARAPLSRMPLFVKAGSIIPVGPAIQYTGEKPGAPITFYVFAGKDGAFDLYEDDGVSRGYERGAWSTIPIRYDAATGAVTIGARNGEFAGMPARRTFNIRWISGATADLNDFDAAADKTVDYAGQTVVIKR
jgi:alpha-D-xyloside xylohydrolase